MSLIDSARTFQVMNGMRRVDFAEYIREYRAYSGAEEIHVGSDSQNFQNHTVYVTTIVFRFPGNGAHVIYRKEKVPKIVDLWTKLWGETERSVDLANAIREECGIRVKQIDLDFNTDPGYPSHKLLNASIGYVSSMGFKGKAKPGLLMAAWAANVLCQ